jgi:hypothetical protein
MKIIAIGSRYWKNYPDFMRYITILIQDAAQAYPDDKNLTFVHSGANGAENMVTEYIGKTEKFMRQKGYHLKEQIFRKDKDASLNYFKMIESGADAAIVFSTNDKLTRSAIELLDEFKIPSVIYEELA